MKNFTFNLFYIALIAFSLSSCGFAEEMTDRAADSPEGMERAYVISLDNTDEDVARDSWEEFMEQYNSNVMRIKGSKVHKADNVAIAGLGGSVAIKSLFEQSGDNTEMRLWFVKNQEYLTPQSSPESYDIIDRFIDDYFNQLETAQIQLEVEREEEKLEDLEKELKKLRRVNEKLHDDITEAEQTIKESRIKIEENLKAQDQMAEKMEEQRDVIQETKRKLTRAKSL